MQIKKWIVLGVILILFATYLLVNKLFSSPANIKTIGANNGYVGDQQCKSCHLDQWKQWQLSDHFKAMLPANDSTVKGNFNNVTYKADGVVSKFFKRGNDFYINTEGPEGLNHDYKVMYTFGYYPLQQYWLNFPAEECRQHV